HLLGGVGHLLGGLDGVEQHDLRDLDVGAAGLVGDLVGQGPAEAPAAEDDGQAGGAVPDVVAVGGGAVGDVAAEAYDAVDGGGGGQAADRRRVRGGGSAGRVERERGGRGRAFGTLAQHADVALDRDFEVGAQRFGEVRDGPGGADVVRGDPGAGALRQAGGEG